MKIPLSFYEFFAGGGMARCGLGDGWECRFANDFDHKKSACYRSNWGIGDLTTADIRTLTTKVLPGCVDLAWGSFPCQDLSLAGSGAGLKGERSGTFYPFWDLMRALAAESRQPKIIALENVCGTITSHEGKDFASICATFEEAGYRFGAVVLDAELFLPHSRPRLFFIGVHKSLPIPEKFRSLAAQTPWHPRSLEAAQFRLPHSVKDAWIWWHLPLPSVRTIKFSDLVEDEPSGIEWQTAVETQALLDSMTPLNLKKVSAAKKSGHRIVGTVYKRTRVTETGRRVCAEVRFDEVSGCLRTPAGGSSRQLLLVIKGESVRSRLISTRETARLMGLPDTYKLPKNYNEGYHLTGDGVAVPVVRHLARFLLEPLLRQERQPAEIAA